MKNGKIDRQTTCLVTLICRLPVGVKIQEKIFSGTVHRGEQLLFQYFLSAMLRALSKKKFKSVTLTLQKYNSYQQICMMHVHHINICSCRYYYLEKQIVKMILFHIQWSVIRNGSLAHTVHCMDIEKNFSSSSYYDEQLFQQPFFVWKLPSSSKKLLKFVTKFKSFISLTSYDLKFWKKLLVIDFDLVNMFLCYWNYFQLILLEKKIMEN